MLLQRKKANSFVPAILFPHGMAFLEKRGGLVPVYVFIFPVFCSSTNARVTLNLYMTVKNVPGYNFSLHEVSGHAVDDFFFAAMVTINPNVQVHD